MNTYFPHLCLSQKCSKLALFQSYISAYWCLLLITLGIQTAGSSSFSSNWVPVARRTPISGISVMNAVQSVKESKSCWRWQPKQWILVFFGLLAQFVKFIKYVFEKIYIFDRIDSNIGYIYIYLIGQIALIGLSNIYI